MIELFGDFLCMCVCVHVCACTHECVCQFISLASCLNGATPAQVAMSNIACSLPSLHCVGQEHGVCDFASIGGYMFACALASKL